MANLPVNRTPAGGEGCGERLIGAGCFTRWAAQLSGVRLPPADAEARMTRFAALLLALAAPSVLAQPGAEVYCSYAPSQSKTVAAISGAAGGAGASISAVSAATGLTVVTHSSGAAILSGSAGYIAGTLGAAAAAPIIVGVSLVVGGAVVTVELVCANRNHPDQVAKVQEAAAEFSRRFSDAMRNTTVAVGDLKKSVVPATDMAVFEVKRTANDVWDYVYRKSIEFAGSLGR